MNPQFRLTEVAIQDIEQIADYIAQQSSIDQAEQFLSKLDKTFSKLTQCPKLGQQCNEILPQLRTIAVDSYLILYIPIGQDIDILRVVSGYRDLTVYSLTRKFGEKCFSALVWSFDAILADPKNLFAENFLEELNSESKIFPQRPGI
jgi:toxin ParE1/3/4